jgi:hypothetical protein
VILLSVRNYDFSIGERQISIEVSAADLERARIILATAEGCGTVEIMRRAEVSSPMYGAGKSGPYARASPVCRATRPETLAYRRCR